jgi:hypothetical protein
MQPEDWDYIPRREFLQEQFKAHDLVITLLSDEEVSKLREDRKQSLEMQLAVQMQQAEIGYKKAQTTAQLTKARKLNVESVKNAQTPPEQPVSEDPRLADETLTGQEIDNEGKITQIERENQLHEQSMRHNEDQHALNMMEQGAKADTEMATKTATAQHSMEMKGKMTEAAVAAKKSAAKSPKTASKPKKPSGISG